ncbi:response regulator [Rhizobium sp. S152]|uniref:response regulator n=1 Tax=Rhizobium sp. S152 TaxID=3055038 RepID=UPI0025A97BD7|nr:response regulator [Rhizobium sp. S152]MDM9625574.1 response regulator [Rhizobium sp. S152]
MDNTSDSLGLLNGKHLLIVEEGFFAADEIRVALCGLGTILMPPAPSVESGMAIIDRQRVDGAILDIRLDETTVFRLVERLQEYGIPFVFVATPPHDLARERYGGYVLSDNPDELGDIARALFDPVPAAH